MGLQKGLILENYATLANVSAWLMIVYFLVRILFGFLVAYYSYVNPYNLIGKVPKNTTVHDIITFTTTILVCFTLSENNQVALPVVLSIFFIIMIVWRNFTTAFAIEQGKELMK